MIKFSAVIKQFKEQGEKTGWTYIEVPSAVAQQLKPGNKKSFRVKGKLDDLSIQKVALIPMGGGNFIMAINASMRKGLKKNKGATVMTELTEDKERLQPPAELLECLADEPKAKEYFDSLAYGHRNYFSNWIESAKTEPTKTKRIAITIEALRKQWDYGTMIRSLKEDRKKLL